MSNEEARREQPEPSDPRRVPEDRIKELRERLYARGDAPTDVRHKLPERPHEPLRSDIQPARPAPEPETERAEKPREEQTVPYTRPMAANSMRSSFRKKFLIFGFLFFVIAIGLSAAFMFLGTHSVSGENISVNVTGPLTVNGGGEYPFQVSIANQNTVPIQSATLIVEYPAGTHSATDPNAEVSIIRQPLDTIGSGEIVNIPLRARIFGEENDEKEIKVSVEYRVEGSNATFEKEAAPLSFKVGTSPVVVTIDGLKSISSGQELDFTITVQSNSPAPLSNLLLKATYPDGFDFTSSKPETLAGEDTWGIDTLKPGEKKVIKVTGLMTGYEDETRSITVEAGVPAGADISHIASMLASATADVKIEKSFLGVDLSVNGMETEPVIMNATEVANARVTLTNSLDTAIYDGKVTIELTGNALDEFNVKSAGGFFDSSKNTITWDSAEFENLKEILPGEDVILGFTLEPKQNVGTAPEIHLKVTAEGSRVFEDRAPEKLSGIAERTVKIESISSVDAAAYHATGPFTNTGPIPPVAEEVTQYTLTFRVKTGANDVTGAEVTAALPQYVSWLDLVSEGADVSYNPTTRTVKWTLGKVDANTTKETSMQVSFKPSLSQVGTMPTILEAQRFKATDRFTGTVVRAEHPAVTTSLTNEPDSAAEDGRVRASE
ncbi:MAG TPA: hypothetical protein VFS75_01805 [Candidatus Paceibacterota bacterium]|nr:hypothetical protein [Candidatus Paceibacterota bacterium]